MCSSDLFFRPGCGDGGPAPGRLAGLGAAAGRHRVRRPRLRRAGLPDRRRDRRPRDLYQIPELGFFVYQTGDYIRSILSKYDCEIRTVVKTGITAFFDFGKKESLCFRADMDALPIAEETGLSFASKNEGCMHACGHDGHMANALSCKNRLVIVASMV